METIMLLIAGGKITRSRDSHSLNILSKFCFQVKQSEFEFLAPFSKAGGEPPGV